MLSLSIVHQTGARAVLLWLRKAPSSGFTGRLGALLSSACVVRPRWTKRATAGESARVRKFIQIVLVMLLLGAGGEGWYLYRKGFSKSWRELVGEELRSRGVELTFSKLTVDPFRGLVAKDVSIFDSPAHRRVLAKVNEMVIEGNYANAVRGTSFVDAITLVDASLELPLDSMHPTGPSVKIERLNARVLLPPDEVMVSRLDAEVFGIHVQATGQLAHLSALFQKARPAREKPAAALVRLVEELRGLVYEGTPPKLDVRFSGDAADADSIVLDVELSGAKIRRGNYRLGALAITANWQHGALVLPRFELSDSVGRLQLFASYESANGAVEMRLRSGMDLPALGRAFHVLDLGDMVLQSVPQLDFTLRGRLPTEAKAGSISAQPSWPFLESQLIGHLRLEAFTYEKIAFDNASADVAWEGNRWTVRDFIIRHRGGGELRGSVQQDYDALGKGDFRFGLTSTMNPEALMPMLRQKNPALAERLSTFKFHDAPKLTISARGPSPLDAAASGEVNIGRVSFRGVEARSGHGNLRYNNRVLHIDDFMVQRAEGSGSGSIAFDFNRETVTVKQVRATLTPQEAILWIDPDLLSDLRPYRFLRKPPAVIVDGTIDTRHGGPQTRLSMTLDGGAMDYTFCGKELHFNNVTARLLFAEERLKLSDVRAELFGGTIKGEADISTRKGKPGHVASLRFSDVDFSSLTKLYFDYDDSKGKLNGTYNFNGRGDDGRLMRGEGDLTITDGNVFAIPFLGPFSDILSKIIPGLGYNRAHRASSSFAIAEGIITTKDFLIEGKGFSMIGDGRIWFLDDRMDFDMRINAQGIPGLLLFPVSKLLEYRTDSKFSKPDWRPKVIPKLLPTGR